MNPSNPLRALLLSLAIVLPPSVALALDWPMYGRDLAGSHYNPSEKQITPATVERLKVKWIFETGDDVSSQPTVVGGVVYFGSWDGKQYAVDAKTGKKLWEFETGYPSRSGAAYADGRIYFGDVGGRLFAVDAKSGQKIWQIKVDPHPMTICTSAPIYYNGRIYIGISSREEVVMMGNNKYECCTFRGGVVAYMSEVKHGVLGVRPGPVVSRAAAIDGDLTVDSRVGGGTVVRVEVRTNGV